MKLCHRCGEPFEGTSWQCPACKYHPLEKEGHLIFAPELSMLNSGFDIQLFSQLAAIEDQNFWYRTRNKLLFWAFNKYFGDRNNFFEIGCGTGYVLKGFSENFPELELSGSEIYSHALEFAARRVEKSRLFQMDARNLPFKNEFDVVGAFDVLEHIEEDEKVLAQMHQAVKPGGGILLTVPQHPFLWSAYDEKDHHVRRYRGADLKRKVERAGFQVERMTSFVCFLLPLMAFSRLVVRKSDPKFNVMTDFLKEGPLNSVLGMVLDIERGLIRAGASLPFGGSLLVAARKKS